LVAGANGQVAQCLVDEAKSQSNLQLTALGRVDMDILQSDHIAEAFEKYQPDLVINAAAYTAVDKAESEPELAMQLNAIAPGDIARRCEARQIPMMHISTDYVFDGTGNEPYTLDCPTAPLGEYGRSKWLGEEAVRQHCSRHYILRTSWVFSEYGNNFVKTMLRLAESRPELGVVSDQRGCPTDARSIAQALLTMARQAGHYGTWHYVGAPLVSWFDFASAIFAEAEQQGLLEKSPQLNAITTAEFPTPAKRPAFSALDMSAITQVFGIEPVPMQHSLQRVLGALANIQNIENGDVSQ
jgi:dTDP-4-dehydrorhamnose reductase